MIVKRTHFVEDSTRKFVGQKQNIFHKVIELDNGIYLLETWKNGSVDYISLSEEQFQKMNNGDFT